MRKPKSRCLWWFVRTDLVITKHLYQRTCCISCSSGLNLYRIDMTFTFKQLNLTKAKYLIWFNFENISENLIRTLLKSINQFKRLFSSIIWGWVLCNNNHIKRGVKKIFQVGESVPLSGSLHVVLHYPGHCSGPTQDDLQTNLPPGEGSVQYQP